MLWTVTCLAVKLDEKSRSLITEHLLVAYIVGLSLVKNEREFPRYGKPTIDLSWWTIFFSGDFGDRRFFLIDSAFSTLNIWVCMVCWHLHTRSSHHPINNFLFFDYWAVWKSGLIRSLWNKHQWISRNHNESLFWYLNPCNKKDCHFWYRYV